MSGLPKGWAVAEIEELLEPLHDGRVLHQGWSPQCEKQPCNDADQWGVLKTTAVQPSRFEYWHHKCLPQHLKPRPGIEVADGDLLLTCAGPRVRCGVACLVRQSRKKLMISGKMYRFRAQRGLVDPVYLEAYLQSRQAQDQIDLMKTGGSDSGLNLTHERFRKLKIILAPYKEQVKIAEQLDEAFLSLDRAVEELHRAQNKLTQYRQSLLKAAVEGALTAPWREQQRAQHAPAETGAQLLQRILTERRARWEAKQLVKFKAQGKAPPKDWQKKYPEPVQPDTTDLPALPQGWVWATIDQLAAVGTGVTPLRSKSQYFDGGTVPWVTSGALNEEMVTAATEMLTPLALQECRMDVYPAGALLVAMYGEGKTRGKCAELGLPATINQAIAALVLEGRALDCKNYLKMFLLKSYDDMRKQASGGVQPNLNLQIVRSICLPLPPANEQEALVDALKVQLDSIQEQQGMVTKMLKQSTAQRQNILRAAFSGQLVPQDPSDEPAADLLARIRAERAAQAPARKPRGRRAQVAA